MTAEERGYLYDPLTAPYTTLVDNVALLNAGDTLTDYVDTRTHSKIFDFGCPVNTEHALELIGRSIRWILDRNCMGLWQILTSDSKDKTFMKLVSTFDFDY